MSNQFYHIEDIPQGTFNIQFSKRGYAKMVANKTSNKTTANGRNKNESNQVQQTWNRITGTMKVYGNTFEGRRKGEKYTKWSCTVAGKSADGEYYNYYLPVRFRGDAEEPETDGLHTIEVSNAFLSTEQYVNKAGDTITAIILVITESEVTD